MSATAPTLVATTGVPHAIASSTTFGQPSRVEHSSSASAPVYTSASSWLRHRSHKVHPVGNAASSSILEQRRALRALADHEQVGIRDVGQRPIASSKPFSGTKLPTQARTYLRCSPNALRAAPRSRRIEHGGIDPVAQHDDLRRIDTEVDECLFEAGRHGHHRRRAPGSPQHPPAGAGLTGDQVDIGAARRHDERRLQPLREQRCRDAIRIEVVGIDQVRSPAVVGPALHVGCTGPGHRARLQADADLGQHHVARIGHLQSTAADITARRRGRAGVPAEPTRSERKPGHWSNHSGIDLTLAQQMLQPSLNKDAVTRLRRTWEERAESQQPEAVSAMSALRGFAHGAQTFETRGGNTAAGHEGLKQAPAVDEAVATQRSMIASRRRIELGQAWLDSTRSRPASASRCALGRIVEHAQDRLGLSRRACRPSAGARPAPHRRRRRRCWLHTTGTPIAIASRILFCVPRAMRSGATVSAARVTYGRTSGTEPVTVTPGDLAELAHRRRRIGADDLQLHRRPPAPCISGSTSAQKSSMHCWFGK